MTTAERVLQCLTSHAARAGDVARELGITPNTAWIAFRTLRQRGAIELVSANGRNRVYRATGSEASEGTRSANPHEQRFYGSEECTLAKVWR